MIAVSNKVEHKGNQKMLSHQ